MHKLDKPIEVRLLGDAKEYFDKQNEKISVKFLKSFDKKSNRTPQNEIRKAERIKTSYFKNKYG